MSDSEFIDQQTISSLSGFQDEKTLNIGNLRKAFERGENIVRLLNNSSLNLSREEIIEVAYDLQAGTYSKSAISEPERLTEYAFELYDHAKDYMDNSTDILDCGTGELTTLSALSQHLKSTTKLLACDISLSRLRKGRRFAEKFMKPVFRQNLRLFVADMARIPLGDNSVDLILTVHALEPNHGRERELLREFLRVARQHLILFEPSWENANKTVRARMERHGYIRDLPRHIEEAGGQLISVKPISKSTNLINPTFCYVVQPKGKSGNGQSRWNEYQCPRSSHILNRRDNYWWSHDGGWTYPEIDGIPCLRVKHGVLMSHA